MTYRAEQRERMRAACAEGNVPWPLTARLRREDRRCRRALRREIQLRLRSLQLARKHNRAREHIRSVTRVAVVALLSPQHGGAMSVMDDLTANFAKAQALRAEAAALESANESAEVSLALGSRDTPMTTAIRARVDAVIAPIIAWPVRRTIWRNRAPVKRAPHADGRGHMYYERFNVGRAVKCVRCHGTPSALWVCKECEATADEWCDVLARYCRPCVPADAAVGS